jgi:hypothetical protein
MSYHTANGHANGSTNGSTATAPDPAAFKRSWDPQTAYDFLRNWPADDLQDRAFWFRSGTLDLLTRIRPHAALWKATRALASQAYLRADDLEALVDADLHTDTLEPSPGTAGESPPPPAAGACWAKALPVTDFLQQAEEEAVSYAADLVFKGGVTFIAAPRGIGKSIAALTLAVALSTGGRFRGEQLRPARVLLVDRDNPPFLVRNRLARLGADNDRLKVLTRDDAPSLRDKSAWDAFPVDAYDVVVVDSYGAATEGVSEKEGALTQTAMATLKTLAYKGVAVLVLDNTDKAAHHYRGRGEKADNVDVLYEARDLTGWTPPAGGDWWEFLPEAGDHAWQSRASRRKGQTVLRLGFVPSKFRLGVEPEPFALELDLRTTPWSLRDVTVQLTMEGKQVARAQAQEERDRLEAAAQVLVSELAARQAAATGPLQVREAESLLGGQGLRRQQVRNLLHDGYNADRHPREGQWKLRPIPGARGNPLGVFLVKYSPESAAPAGSPDASPDGDSNLGTNNTPPEPQRNDADFNTPICAVGSPATRHKSAFPIVSNGADFNAPICADQATCQRHKSTNATTSNGAGENGGGLFVPKESPAGEDESGIPI